MGSFRSYWAEILVAARRQAGMTQAELARKAGMTQQAISDYERSLSNPSDEAKIRIAAALGRSPNELFPLPETNTEPAA